jgi:hypothetical protein
MDSLSGASATAILIEAPFASFSVGNRDLLEADPAAPFVQDARHAARGSRSGARRHLPVDAPRAGMPARFGPPAMMYNRSAGGGKGEHGIVSCQRSFPLTAVRTLLHSVRRDCVWPGGELGRPASIALVRHKCFAASKGRGGGTLDRLTGLVIAALELLNEYRGRCRGLEKQLKDLEFRRIQAQKELDMARLSAGRFDSFQPDINGQLQCPSCWLAARRNNHLNATDSPADADAFRCLVCNYVYTVPC